MGKQQLCPKHREDPSEGNGGPVTLLQGWGSGSREGWAVGQAMSSGCKQRTGEKEQYLEAQEGLFAFLGQ